MPTLPFYRSHLPRASANLRTARAALARAALALAALAALALSGCQLLPAENKMIAHSTLDGLSRSSATIDNSWEPLLIHEERCAGHFVTHHLDHVTMAPGGETIRMFEANGGGVAINDLDGDGWQDIVLANHRDPNTILWNQGVDGRGAVHFKTAHIGRGDARAVTTVDVDGDGLLDIVFSRRVSAPNYWRNLGSRQFELTTLAGVTKPLYAINWADLDLDGDLDLVGGTYDAGLLAEFGHEFLNGSNAGVFVYYQADGAFREQVLALNAQALALALVDINGDRRPDILVGNDFGVPDYSWLNLPAESQSKGRAERDSGPEPPIAWEALPVNVMSHSSMSYAAGDIDNDGTWEVLTTDMMPYADDPATMAAWAPVMASMMEGEDGNHSASHEEPQVMANVLRESTGLVGGDVLIDLAPQLGIHASGWSWSGKFGDLDQDGLLDLYIVNGMVESTTFAHLPNHELMEENQAFRNVHGERYVPSPAWQLNATGSGRGMSMADLDNDGDLDIVVNNLRSPATFFENQLCRGSGITLDITWLASDNMKAIGSVVTLHTDAESNEHGKHEAGAYRRQIEAASGYLSGDSAQIHFGFAEDVTPTRLEIQWSDGVSTTVEPILANHRLRVVRKPAFITD